MSMFNLLMLVQISIHAPREGRDSNTAAGCAYASAFQSTRPARGATQTLRGIAVRRNISIHAPREGRDRGQVSFLRPWRGFQSTRPARGATTVAYGDNVSG